MSDCMLWEGCKSPTGYGKVRHLGKVVRAHRLAYCQSLGKPLSSIDGLHVLHSCDNPSCVNPEHLFEGTHQDNMNDMAAKGRRVNVRGQQQGQSKLSVEDVNNIRARYKYHCRTNGSSALAKEFGVHHSTIQRCVKEVTYQTTD